ncbi:MAG: arginine--tRNA ligase [Methanophagales archaeon ANME-1-THS]|nr:MAG: arginine--tRNA ligase [Methanophagales archaeon ANME-1-THS]
MFLEFKREVERVLRDALQTASLNCTDLDLDLEESEHADLSSRVAFSLARMCDKPPAIIAADIVRHIAIPAEDTFIADAGAVGPYINFSVNDSFVHTTLEWIRGGLKQPGQKKGKIIIEHTSANPDGPLHIGHLRNAVIGDVLVRVLKRAGYEVETHYYVNDMGRQIALVVWGAERMAYDETKKADHAVAKVYIAANRLVEQNAEFVTEVEELMRKYEAGDETVIQKYNAAVKKCLSGIQASLERLQIQHDVIVWESEFVRGGAVEAVIEELKQKGDIKRDGSALVLQLEGIEKALVIQRTDGTSLYTTRDLAYHRWKAGKGDRVIDVFGKDHELVSQQLVKALELLDVRVPEFVIFEFVSLPTGSLSTRAGRYIAADELMDKIEERAYQEVAKKRDDLDERKKREIARKVGIGALRYDMVKVSPDKHILFNFDEALDIEKKGAPFIQYAHARACSILHLAVKRGYAVSAYKAHAVTGQSPAEDYNATLLAQRSERELITKLSKLSAIIDEASSELKPHLIAKYARELAESFNLFYKDCPVLNADEELRKARLVLVECARIVLSAVLDMLGIEAPSEM